jgi:hypothetical protein
MPAGKSSKAIKKVIDCLRKKRMSQSELLVETGLPERTLRRILTDSLASWGLIIKDKEGNWAWYETTKLYATKIDLEIALEHSRKLIPGLDLLAASVSTPEQYVEKTKGLVQQDVFALKEAAENHIRTGYPILSAQLTKLENLNAQRKCFFVNVIGESSTEDWSSLLQDIHNFRGMKLAVSKKNLGRVQKLVGKISSDKLALIDELEEQWQTGSDQASKDIRDLERKIEHGTPLEGKCKFCPAVSVTSS